jgi:hypothetical protein
MKKYTLENNVHFKILLILYKAPGPTPFIGGLHPNIKLAFLLPHTTSLNPPMDQEVTVTFKAYYQRRTFAQDIAATEENTEKVLMQFWKDYNIYNCINNLALAWVMTPRSVVNDIWKNTLKSFGQCCKEFV